MNRRQLSFLLPIGLVVLGFAVGWMIRARIASDGSAAADAGSCFLFYRIGDQQLRIQTPDGVTQVFERVVSGDGQIESIAKRSKGPLPPGAYVVLTRDDGKPTYKEHPAFILDPIDALPGNDRIDGPSKERGGGRSAFRIHGGVATQGCLASQKIDQISELLLPHGSVERFDIYSQPADSGRDDIKRFREVEPGSGKWEAAPEDGNWELFEQERRVGLLWVLP